MDSIEMTPKMKERKRIALVARDRRKWDLTTPQPHEVDLKALLRMSVILYTKR